MNRKKFEKLKNIIEKLEKNGFFSMKKKMETFIKTLFLRFKEDAFDIFLWPVYFFYFPLSFKFLFIERFVQNHFPNSLKMRIEKFYEKAYEIRVDDFYKSLTFDEKKFAKSFFAKIFAESKTLGEYGNFSLVRFNSLFKSLIVKDQYHTKELIKDGYCVLDCGANVGVFSLCVAYLNKKGKIYAIEPVEESVNIMKRLFEFFEVKNVKIIKKAVGDEKKKAFINVNKIGLGSSTLLNVNYGIKEEIEIDKIDNIVKEEKIKKVDFIKMDIEGYERYALKGAIETIKKHKPIIVVSAYHLKDDKKVLPQIIKSTGVNYEVKLSKRDEEDFIFIPKLT